MNIIYLIQHALNSIKFLNNKMIKRTISPIHPLKTDSTQQTLAIPGYKELDRLINNTTNTGNALINTEVEDPFRYSHNPFESSILVDPFEKINQIAVPSVESKEAIREEIKKNNNPYEKEFIDAGIDVQSMYSEFVESDKFPKTVLE